MNHKELTAHIRHRLAKAGINAKCKMQDLCGHKMIAVDVPKHGVTFNSVEQSLIADIVTANRLTYILGGPVTKNGTLTFGGKFQIPA